MLDTADRIAWNRARRCPRAAISSVRRGPARGLWATDTAVNAVLTSQWALYQVLTRLGLSPTPSPATAAARCWPWRPPAYPDRADAGAAARRARGHLPRAGVDRGHAGGPAGRRGRRSRRAEAACRGRGGRCPSPSTTARTRSSWPARRPRSTGSSRGSAPRASSARSLPFARAYHTPGFAAVLGPLDAFFASLELHPAPLPVYSCSTAARDARMSPRRSAAGGRAVDPAGGLPRDDRGDVPRRPAALRRRRRPRQPLRVRRGYPPRSAGLRDRREPPRRRGRPSSTTSSPRCSRRARHPPLSSTHAAGPAAWTSTHRQPAGSTFRIEVGFPEMRLSEESDPPARSAQIEHRSRARAGVLERGRASTNGEPHAGPRNEESDVDDHSHQRACQRMDMRREPVRTCYPSEHPLEIGLSFVPSGRQLEASTPGICSSTDEPAMLDFLETMNDFLNTQREVMRLTSGARCHR